MKAVAALIALGLAAQQSQPQQRPVFRTATDLVTVEVSVRSGHTLVAGLSAADFALTDNGVPQDVMMLDVEALPIDVTLVLDTSGSMAGVIDAVAGYSREIQRLLRPDDRLRVITVAADVSQVAAFHSPAEDPPLAAPAASGSTSIYDGIIAALMHVRRGDRRHVAVVMTDGIDTSSALSVATLKDLSRHTDSVLQVVLLMDPGVSLKGASPSPLDTRRTWAAPQPGGFDYWQLREAADNTGGQLDLSFAKTGGVPTLVKEVLDKFRTSYVLRYRPTGESAGWHALEVKVVKHRGADVRARKGYFVSSPGR